MNVIEWVFDKDNYFKIMSFFFIAGAAWSFGRAVAIRIMERFKRREISPSTVDKSRKRNRK